MGVGWRGDSRIMKLEQWCWDNGIRTAVAEQYNCEGMLELMHFKGAVGMMVLAWQSKDNSVGMAAISGLQCWVPCSRLQIGTPLFHLYE